ncbi:His-Me finger endonuclease [Neocallimastix lanati (nom. inval.)]|jgi:endonuclease G|uniref:His-Me finger endonuclease n=1 Tax=Neocallimastix californiae TaxID=1754190 RepID=A0A1Y2D4Y6_9FUNG|nr:His-Me finger endonuclease [Neocallimastix sp. JGI-2020a]ORY54333.1 His-Me finger endonuclease [Neocallimastix californiae]|eukprot:ORY54333.1 His-Me finger endonuclease [Neocallimastix californiae]
MYRKLLFFVFIILNIIQVFSLDIKITHSNKYSGYDEHSHGIYDVCYVGSLGISEYVAYTLTKVEAVESERNKNRTNNFRSCPLLQNKSYITINSTKSDYKNSGYDKGHLCPNNDRDFDVQSASLTFLMCNMTPQTHLMNAGNWKNLEDYGHELAKKYGKIDIVSGPIFTNENIKTIGKGVAVPDSFYKIFYNKENNFLECYTVTQSNVQQSVTLGKIKKLTGIKFTL